MGRHHAPGPDPVRRPLLGRAVVPGRPDHPMWARVFDVLDVLALMLGALVLSGVLRLWVVADAAQAAMFSHLLH